MDDSGDVVQPAIPEFLGHLNTADRRATRLDLANWLVSPQNPLTARVYMNRMWSEYFGAGISKSVEDFGSQGDWPSHLELLNWLAAEFMNPQYDAAEHASVGYAAHGSHHCVERDVSPILIVVAGTR